MIFEKQGQRPFRRRRRGPLGPLAAFLCGLTMVLVGGGGCQRSGDGAVRDDRDGDKIVVVATVGMVADLVRQVGGEHVVVQQICGSGIDPHSHSPTRDDVQKFLQADVIFYNGLKLEGKMADKLAALSKSKPVVAIAETIPEDHWIQPEPFQGHADPHVWMDVGLWSKTIAAITRTLADFDPPHSGVFESNANVLRSELSSLDDYVRQSIGSIPEDSRLLITSHDAFNYLGRAYGLEVEGIQGISTESEAGLRRINDLVDRLVRQNVAAVFVESSVNPKNIQALIEGARSRGHDVRNGGELFSDAMGADGTYRGTYIGMIDHNATTITRSLGGVAPAGGFSGRLGLGATANAESDARPDLARPDSTSSSADDDAGQIVGDGGRS